MKEVPSPLCFHRRMTDNLFTVFACPPLLLPVLSVTTGLQKKNKKKLKKNKRKTDCYSWSYQSHNWTHWTYREISAFIWSSSVLSHSNKLSVNTVLAIVSLRDPKQIDQSVYTDFTHFQHKYNLQILYHCITTFYLLQSWTLVLFLKCWIWL